MLLALCMNKIAVINAVQPSPLFQQEYPLFAIDQITNHAEIFFKKLNIF